MIVRRASWLALGVLGGLLAAPAGALESASGSYEGKLVCKELDGGQRDKTKQEVTLGVFDDGAGEVLMQLGSLGTFAGFLLTDTKKPETGTLSAVNCTLDETGLAGAALHAEVKVKAGSDKASLKGTVVQMDLPGEAAALCQLKVERVSPIPPKLPVCP